MSGSSGLDALSEESPGFRAGMMALDDERYTTILINTRAS